MAIRGRPEGGSEGSGGIRDSRGSRRRNVTMLTVPLAALALVAGLLTTFTGPASAQDDPPPGLVPEGNWTPDQVDFMLDLIDRTEQALPAFSDGGKLDEAMLEGLGFVNFGATAPGGWDHWINMSWIDDDHILDPAHPESLVFRSVGGEWMLEAAMFFLRSDDRMEDISERYPDIAWLPGWHAHPGLCWDENGVSASCDVGEPVLIPMTHVWITDNPCGHRFAGVDAGGILCGDHHHDPDHDPGHDPDHEPGPVDEVCSWTVVDAEDLAAQVTEGEEDVSLDLEPCDGEDVLAPGQPAPPVPGRPGFTG